MQSAIEALQQAYRRAGHTTVQVFAPEQELTGGIVKLPMSCLGRGARQATDGLAPPAGIEPASSA
ncbi:POTRA domain-containing protein [Variovorax terrae]|uniref:POTRA domain-containing protein n=1 Tax=Variovorax terrae TaxID=2923278 RepID=UPI003C6FFB39